MNVRGLLKMCNILVLCPVLFAAGALTLTIDSQLRTSIEDCFERISIGEQLPSRAIYLNKTELTTRECEKLCKKDKQCQSFDYGVGAKGNATCDLSNVSEKEIQETKILQRHPDYDVYVRRFQCEQSPPTPIQGQFDDPRPGPTHRPVFRPDVPDNKRPDFSKPQSDEIYRPNDLRPHGEFYRPRPVYSSRPQYYNYYDIPYNKPYIQNSYNNHLDERPDDYTNQRPEFDTQIGYGVHKPPDLPYRPNKPGPDDHTYGKPKPDPYDVLQFQDQYNKPQIPLQNYRPDPHYPPAPADDIPDLYGKPEKPSSRPEDKPQYVYVTRPIRKPYGPQIQRPQNEQVYGQDYHSDLGSSGQNYYNRPNIPYPSHYNHDNSIYLEINDPPYRPSKPGYDTSQPSNYGQNYHIPNEEYHKPSRPYGINDGYGSQSYGLNRPYYRPQNVYRPFYDSLDSGPIQYGSSHGYGNKPSHDNSPSYNNPAYDNKPTYQKPSYGSTPTYNKPINDRPSYDSSPSYDKPTYGNKPSYDGSPSHDNKPAYSSSPSYDNKPSYGSSPSYDKPSYDNKPAYGSGPSYDNKPAYGSSPSYDKPSYDNKPAYGSSPSYDKPSYDNKPAYGSSPSYDKPSYDNKPAYGSSPSYDKPYDNKPSYGSSPSYDKPSNDNKPAYGNSPSYDNKPSYSSSPSYDKPSYDNKPSYSSSPSYDKPSYDNKPPYSSSPSYDKPSYDNKPAYGSSPSYDKPSHNQYRPDPEYNPIQSGYGKPDYSEPSYGSDDYKNNHFYGHKPNSSKPVYEYESNKPNGVPSYILKPGGQIISSHPVTISDYGDGRPALGREPMSYKLCFRRVLAGRRTLRSHVRRVVACERLEDCRRECATERRFHCESFNYRLDPAFRGKGLCEMMTKPIEAFNLRRDFVEDKDYDFYELDRNSLEPNCPNSLRGPGHLHSGYLASKDWRPGYQEEWRGGYENWGYNDRNYYKDPYDRYDNRNNYRRRHEHYIPYQIGNSRSNDDQGSWGQYGGSYGGHNYYKNPDVFRDTINHWRLNYDEYERPDPFYGVKPYDPTINFDYYSLGRSGHSYGAGRKGWNGSGSMWNELSYGESNYYGPKKQFGTYEERNPGVIKDCSSRRRAGMSLGSGAIRRALYAQTVLDCETACFNEREFKCVSYSYRYSNSHGADNCFLSERPYRGLDLASDSGSDVYAMPADQPCSVSHKPWIESECFWHVRSGSAVSGTSVKVALTVAGLGACEAECIRARGFFCRGFSFRFDSPTIGDDIENCLLTSSPPTSLQPGHEVRPTPGHELYARGNYGRGCEPALYDEGAHRQCYLKYDNAARLIGAAIRGQTRVRDEQACGSACTDAPFRCLSFSFSNNSPANSDNCLLSEIRLFDLQRGVDYEHSSDDWLFAFDLFNGQCWRKAHPGNTSGKDDDHTHAIPRPISPSGPSGPSYGPPTAASGPSHRPPSPPSGPSYGPPSPPSGPSYGPPAPPSGPSYGPPSPPSGPSYGPPSPPSGPSYGPPALPSGPSYRPPIPPSGPNYGPYLPKPDPPVFNPGSGPSYLPSGPSGPSFRPPSGPSGPSGPSYGSDDKEIDDGAIQVSFRHYTVSGFPCRRGTSCAQNLVAGHWSCEPEGGEVGSWDYCCAPQHRCGYSEGFHKPWCYVGSARDQWRPCSEKYYPYHQHNVPHPSQGHREEIRLPRPRPGYEPTRPWSQPSIPVDSYLPVEEDRRKPAFIGAPYLPEADRKYWDDLYKNGPSAYYDRYGNPLPGYVRVPTETRPRIKYHHNYGNTGQGHWVPVSGLDSEEGLDPPVPGGLGVPRYWPVAYLHKGPPPNMTYFRFNETNIDRSDRRPVTTSTAKYQEQPKQTERPNDVENNNKNHHRDEKTRNITAAEKDIFKTETTTIKIEELSTEKAVIKDNISAIDNSLKENLTENSKGIDGKVEFTDPIEVLDIEDAKTKGEKQSELKTLEAEERQIEAIGRLLATRRGGKLVLEKRSQKDLETKNIAIDKELLDDLDFGAKFPTINLERRGIIQRVSKDEIEIQKRNNDRSLEVSETTYVRPPRVLNIQTTTDNIRKAYVNGKVFYDATVRDQRELFDVRKERKQKAINVLKSPEDSRINPLTQSHGRKKIKPRNVNPVRRVRRVYRKRYNPEEVRKRLLQREKNVKEK